MCEDEKQQALQRGMNYRLNANYSVILMSQRSNAPYSDEVYADGITIEYEGHDESRKMKSFDPKRVDQPKVTETGRLTQNGLFIKAVEDFKSRISNAELVKVYEKILPGVWSMKGIFDLVDFRIKSDGNRNVFRFILHLSERKVAEIDTSIVNQAHTRLIPSDVKKNVWKRDGGKCVICGDIKNLHFDHELPFSKGGTSLSEKNIRLLCMKHNLQKSSKIE